MNKKCYLGIDTSNYTTSIGIVDGDGEIVANIKRSLAVEAGERGLRQSDALFAHIKNLPLAFDEAKKILCGYTVAAVGVSAKPRDEVGSYMPCFLSGVAAAHSFCASADTTLYEFSHQCGHITAALLSAGKTELVKEEFIAFHVSGGTTEALYVTPRNLGFSVRIIGGTKDLNAGQAIDRVGVLMGLPFPCGCEIEKLALDNKAKIPAAKISVTDGYCNLSGLENMAAKLYRDTNDKGLVAAFTLDFVGKTLLKICADIKNEYDLPLVFAGGVMSNKIIREMILKKYTAHFASPALSSDNAVGIAYLAKLSHENKI